MAGEDEKPIIEVGVEVKPDLSQAEQAGEQMGRATAQGQKKGHAQVTQDDIVSGLATRDKKGRVGTAPTVAQVRQAAGISDNSALRSQLTRDNLTERSKEQRQRDVQRHTDLTDINQRRTESRRKVIDDRDAIHQDTQARRVRRSRSLNEQESQYREARSRESQGRTLRSQENLANAQVSTQIGPGRRQRRLAKEYEAQQRTTFGGIMRRSVMSSLPFTAYGLMQGNVGPLAGSIGRGLLQAGAESFRQYGAYRSAMAAGAAGIPVSQAATTLSGLGAAAPAFAVGGAFALGGAAYLGASQLEASVDKSRQGLYASIGGLNGGEASMYGQLVGAAGRFYKSKDTAIGIANQLGSEGVGAGNINADTQNTLALSAITGMDSTKLEGLTAKMATGGGMSGEDIGVAFGKLWSQVSMTGISINKLTTNLQALQDATGGVNINVSSMAAVAKTLPSGLTGEQLGNLQSPLLNATGTQGIMTSAVLGISPERLMQLQGVGGKQANPAALMDLTSGFLKRATAGTTGAQRTLLAETISNSLGLLDTTGVSAKQQAGIFNTLLNGKAGQFGALADQLSAQPALTGGSFRALASGSAGSQTGALDKIENTLSTTIYGVLNDINGNMSHLYNFLAGHPVGSGISKATTPGGGGNPYGGGGAHLTINRSTVPGGVANSPFDFSGGQITAIQAAAKRYGIPWQVLAAQVAREGGTPGSAAGGGIGQFIPSTAASLVSNPNSPVYNKPGFESDYALSTKAMAFYDQSLIRQTGSLQAGIAAYNGSGPAAQAYGQDVIASANTIQMIQVTGTLNDANGTPVGTINSSPQRMATGRRGPHAPTIIPGSRGKHTQDSRSGPR